MVDAKESWTENDAVKLEEGAAAETVFVDYVPPPRPPVPPPAKYKLALVIYVLVYFVAWFATGADILSALMSGLAPPDPDHGLRLHGALFVLFMIEITVMVFFGVEVVIGLTRVKIGGTWYGLLPWLMQPRAQWYKKYDNFFAELIGIFIVIAEDGFAVFNAPKPPQPPQGPKVFDFVDKNKPVTLQAKHKVDPDKIEEYEQWVDEMKKTIEAQPGFLSIEREETVDNVHTWKMTWATVDDLNNAMANPQWVRNIKKLEPLLDAPKITQLMMENPPTNAVADLLTRQGDSTPSLPPKKWKVWWTTTCSLFFAHLILENTLRMYYDIWGWDEWKSEVLRLVDVAFLVWTLSYIVNPCINLLFSEWLRRKPDEQDTKFPWKQLNDGFIPPIQLVGLIAYFAATGAKWATK